MGQGLEEEQLKNKMELIKVNTKKHAKPLWNFSHIISVSEIHGSHICILGFVYDLVVRGREENV